MLGADGEVRVTDFGIARIAGDVSLTSVGTILGTSGYMSPEQAVGGTATAASDRYGLAVVAFELLCGRRPYQRRDLRRRSSGACDRPRSRRRRDSTVRCRRRSIRCSSARSRRTRRSVIGPAASWSRISRRRSPTAPERPCGWSVRRRRRPPPSSSPRASQRHARGDQVERCDRCRTRVALALLGILLAGSSMVAARPSPRPPSSGRQPWPASPRCGTVTVDAKPIPEPRAGASGPRPGHCQWRRAQRPGVQAVAQPATRRPRCRFSSVPSTRCKGSGSLTEAYALYNLALARFSTR